jgi:hypothetical protein
MSFPRIGAKEDGIDQIDTDNAKDLLLLQV